MIDLKGTKIKIEWPDLEFPPVNLNVMLPAYFYYMSEQDREDYIKKAFSDLYEHTLDVL